MDADTWFAVEAVDAADRTMSVSLDMRYVGQNFELAVPVGVAIGGRLPRLDDAKKICTRFFAVHDQYYGFHSATDPVEVINMRLTASAVLTRLAQPKFARAKTSRSKPIDQRRVWFARRATAEGVGL